VLFSTYYVGQKDLDLIEAIRHCKVLIFKGKFEEASASLECFLATHLHYEIRISACLLQLQHYFNGNINTLQSCNARLISALNNSKDEINKLSTHHCHDIWSLLQASDDYDEFILPKIVINRAKSIDFIASLKQKEAILGSSKFDLEQNVKTRKIMVCSPPKTGFFSYLETICLNSYFASRFSSEILIDMDNWRYAGSLQDLVPCKVESFSLRVVPCEFFAGKEHILLTRDRSLSLILGSVVHQIEYARWKQKFYASFQIKARKFLEKHGLNLIKSSTYAVFLRLGDKIYNESLSPSIVKCLSALDGLKDVIVMSDSQIALRTIKIQAGERDLVILPSINPLEIGYCFGSNDETIEATQDILMKFVTMTAAKHILACPSSNIVNAAFASMSSFPILPYLGISPLSLFRPTLTV